jgi:energy-coupling factor transporter transmembrane protein EcfT
MIVRDWQRLAWNVLLGPPLAWLVALIVLCLMLAIPPMLRGADASLVMLVLIVGIPAIPLSYLYGVVPFLLVGLASNILARAVRGEGMRALTAAVLSAVAFGWMAIVMIGPQRQFDSAELNDMLKVAAPIGGFVAAAACAWLTERFGSRKGLPEDYI